jgi:hypothetical protein
MLFFCKVNLQLTNSFEIFALAMYLHGRDGSFTIVEIFMFIAIQYFYRNIILRCFLYFKLNYDALQLLDEYTLNLILIVLLSWL